MVAFSEGNQISLFPRAGFSASSEPESNLL